MPEKAKVPAIRFKGFNDAWEQRKASELFVATADKGYPELPVLSATQDRGMIKRDDNNINIFHDKKNEEGYKRVLPGQFVIHLRSFQGGFAHSAIEGITSPAYTVFGFKEQENHYDIFWKYIFASKEFIRRLETVTYGIRDGRSISYDEFLTMSFLYPKAREQKHIAGYLSTLDNLITLHQRKLLKLKNIKKAMLEKMFPKNGRNVPEIRFAGFTDAWEQRKLKDLVQFSKGSGYSKADLKENGTPIILYGRLYTKYETVISNVDTFAEPKPGSVFSCGGEVIVPASGETAEDISIASVVEKSGIILGGDLNVISPNKDIDPAFLALCISTGEPHLEMAKKAQGKSVVHLHNSDLEKINLLYPKFDEQKEISSYFSHLDKLITLHQRKLEKLQNLKKAFLEKMFV